MFSGAWTPVTCFPAPGTDYVHVFPRLDIGYMFSGAWTPVTCFPALGTDYIHVFPRLDIGYMFSGAWTPVTCFPTPGTDYTHVFPRLDIGYMFSRRAWYKLHVFARLAMAVRADWPSVITLVLVFPVTNKPQLINLRYKRISLYLFIEWPYGNELLK